VVYCVETQKEVREVIRNILKSGGFSQKDIDSVPSLMEALDKKIPELILLDVDFPGESYIKILDDLKNSPVLWQIPVVLMSRKNDIRKLMLGFEHGADDFISEKTGALEFIARLEAILRRSPGRT